MLAFLYVDGSVQRMTKCLAKKLSVAMLSGKFDDAFDLFHSGWCLEIKRTMGLSLVNCFFYFFHGCKQAVGRRRT